MDDESADCLYQMGKEEGEERGREVLLSEILNLLKNSGSQYWEAMELVKRNFVG